MKPHKNQELEIEIETSGIYGEGVGRLDGFTFFVDGALPKERVRVVVDEVRSTFARAHPIEFLLSSPHRISPPCPLFGKCGGCQLMHLDYPQQLIAKQKRVEDALKRIGKIECEVKPCTPSPSSLAYRNKIQLPVNENNKLGLYTKNTHDIVPIEQCLIHSPLGEEIFQAIKKLLQKNPIASLRHVLIKTAFHTKEGLVVLVTHDEKPLTDFAHAIMQKSPFIKGVVQNCNPDKTNTILGKKLHILAGRGWIEEQLCHYIFRISPTSFFQVNPAQAENLYQIALEQAKLKGQETILDAYCGVGTLSLFFSGHAAQVIGIEVVEEAIQDAKENAKRNHVTNASFIHGKVEEKIFSLKELDVALLNPPRKGCDRIVLEALAKKRPSRIIYISCDPATLARDLHILVEKEYVLEQVQPVDMFPQTMHVECVATLKLKS